MSPSGAEFIRQVKSEITEIDPSAVHELLGNGVAIIDVRETEEFATGHLPGAMHVPRGYLESRIEGVVPDRSQRVILYCASGNRSALAARTLSEDLGYETRRVDDRRHHAVEGPRLRGRRPEDADAPSSATATRATCSSPRSARRASASCSTRASCCSAPAASARRPRSTSRRPGVGTLGIVDNDVVDLSNLQRQVIHTTERIGVPKVDSAEETINALNPDVEVVKYPVRLDASNIMEIIEGWDVIVDGLDNFPTRYLLNDASVRLQIPVVSASILGFDGQLSVFKPYDGPVLPLPVPRAAAGRAGALVRRQRRARRAARDDGPAAGDRGHQADRRRRRAGDRPPAALRRARGDADGGQGPARPRLPDLLARARLDHRRGDGRVPRLRGVLRRGRVGSRARWRRSRSHRCCARRSAASARSPRAGANVGEVLAGLVAAHPATQTQLFGADGELNRYVNVYLNDEDVRVLDGLDTAVGESDVLVILPAMAGGA